MLLTRVTLKDYGIYQGKNEFDFSTTPEKPIILIGGTNGAGKTTLFESIMLCLYGISAFDKKISRNTYDKHLAKKIHKYSKTTISADHASVIVEFQFSHNGEMAEYCVERAWKSSKGKIDEQLIIKKKDHGAKQFEMLDKIEESYWQSFIDNLIPRGIVNLFFFDGERIVKMAEEGNADIAVRSSFNSLLGLDIVDKLRNDLQINLMRNLTGNQKHLEDGFNKYTKEKEELKQKNERMQKKQVGLNSELIDVRKEIDDLEFKMSQIGGEFAIKRNELKSSKIKYELEIDSISNEIRNMCSTSLPFSLISEQLQEIQKQIQKDELVLTAKMETAILDAHAKKLHASFTAKEFWAGIDIDSTAKKTLISNITKMIKPTFTDSENTKTELFCFSSSQSSKILDVIDQSNGTMLDNLETYTRKLVTINEELKKIDTALINAPNDDEIGPKITKLGKIHSEFTLIQTEIDRMDQEISSNKALVRHIDVKIRNIIAERYENKKSQRKTELTEKVQIVLDRYAEKLRAKKMKFLEEYLLDALHVLLHKKQFIKKVSIDKETFQIKLYEKNNEIILKDMLSKGEQQMFATAVLWALAKTSGRPLPFMIDTPLARLDNNHRINLIKKFFPLASHQVLILSTDSEIDATNYSNLLPFISRSYTMQYEPESGKTIQHDGYFWNRKGERVIAV